MEISVHGSKAIYVNLEFCGSGNQH